MRTIAKFLVCAILLCGLAVLPVFANAQKETGAAKPAGKTWVIGMSQCNLGEPWRVQMNADIKAEADKHPEIKMIFKDAQNDVLQQRAQVEEYVSSKIDLLIISPKEAQPLAEPVSKAMAAGIPVIVLDRDIIGQNYTQFIGADNVKIGRAVGQWLVKNYGGKGAKVVEIMGLQTSTRDRTGITASSTPSRARTSTSSSAPTRSGWSLTRARRWSPRWRASTRSTSCTATTIPPRTAPTWRPRRWVGRRAWCSSASIPCRKRA